MNTRPDNHRDFIALGKIIAAAQEHKPSEHLILKRDLGDRIDAFVLQMYQSGLLYEEAVNEFRKQFLKTVLEECNWNQCHAAKMLQMHRNTLSRTLAVLGIKTQRPYHRKGPQHG